MKKILGRTALLALLVLPLAAALPAGAVPVPNVTILPGALAAEDFGVFPIPNASGMKGYTAGFGLTDATFAGVQSVVTQLFASTTLLQTDTLMVGTANVDALTGTQISSPFDVFGTFDYVADGYWTNVRSAEFGQTMIPTRVVATVTLANGKVVTAENDNLTGDPATIFPPVSNATTTTVTIVKYLNGILATASSTNSASFPMTATWNATNTGAGTGGFSLGSVGFNNATPYEATTADMTMGASYSTNEVTGGPVVGATCASERPFALAGYSIGATLSAAAAASITTSTPSFTNLSGDEFVIVHNVTCSHDGDGNSSSTGGIGGEVLPGVGTLAVTSITVIKSTTTADGTFGGGWEYIFHITAPTNEPNLAMRFADWINGANTSTIPVANNMRISSAQANNTSTVLLTAANSYSTPALNMITDLNPGMPGRQVDVAVEVAVPAGTAAGSYTTTYGVQTNP